MATALFDRWVKSGDDLMREVWSPTPWMTNAYTGDCASPRDREMLDWLHDHFGEESSPIHSKVGSWHRSGATVFGWTWFGFATENQMRQFEEAWPCPPEVQAAP